METIEEQARSECRGSPNSSDEAVVQGSPDHTEIVQTGERICLVGNLMDDCEMLRVAHSFNMHVVNSENGESVLEDDEYWNTRYIIKEFNGPEYERINAAKKCILGPPALKWVSHRNLKLPYTSRAVYSFAMRGVVACFTGLRNKEELTTMVMMIHSMGGAIRKDMNSRITHLIANHSTGDKYQYAKTFRLPVLRTDWVAAAWAKREDPTFSAVDESFASQYRLHIFAGQRICLSGFSDDEYLEMRAIMLANGGTPVELDDPTCTHVVVYSAAAKKEPANPQSIIVTAEWFWYTIQNGYADTSDFLMGDKIVEAHQQMTPNTDRRESLPISFNNKRKRKRFSQRLQLEGTPLSTGKRRSSVSDAGLLSVSSSFFDFTSSPDKLENTSHMSTDHKSSKSDQTPGKKASMRHNHFMDFYSTESNYVGILDTIVQLFKNPLEKMLDEGDPLLNKAEIHAIFSNFQPIYDVHLQMLQALREIHHNWTDTCLIGDIILEHQADLTRAYPKYVNCFEQMQETLQHCDSAYPRFHAFLKINQTKPECGRQTLQDLMIRPVQRLPSISLLLTDILKYTSKSNPDHARLTEALKSLKEVTTYINEDKRKTDARVAMFDVFNGIDGCPPELISSNRDFVAKIDIIEMTDMMSGRGDSLVLYLFSDYIEFCKKRTRVFNTAKSPSTGKVCKHLQLMSLNSILHVVDITDGARAFALVTKDCTYAYSIVDDDATKAHYVSLLCKQIAQNACVTDIDNFHLSRTSLELGVDISDIHMSTLSKAFKLATRTRLKVGRAFSFSKTPSKLKRTTSTMMTPPFGSNNTVIMTPASQLAQMQLASCNNVNETDDEQNTRNSSTDSDSQIVPLKAPLSEQPKRKNKSATIGRI